MRCSEVRRRSVVAALLASSFAGCSDSSTALPPADLAYSQNPAVYVVGEIISPNVPSSGGGRATSYGVSPDLPPGLQLDPGGGVISGTPLETADGSWAVTASNAAGSTTTALKIRVNPPPAPVFFLQPSDQVASPDTEVMFSAAAHGWGTHRYQWYRSGVAIEGATSSTFTTRVGCGDQNSTYSCTITDEFGSAATSREAAVRIEGFSHLARTAFARASHTATLLPSGSVLVAGGTTGPFGLDITQTAELYDPVARAWVTTGSLVEPRHGHTATLLPSGKVLVTGGGNRTSEIYDPGTGEWSAAAPLAEPRRCNTATLLPSGKVLVVGGGSVVDSHIAPLSSCEVYDPQAGVWSAASSMSTPRCGHSATLLSSGVVLVMGGRSTSAGEIAEIAEIYDPRTDTWSAAGSLTVSRVGDTVTLLDSGSVLVAGGVSSDGFLRSAELYVVEAGASIVTGSLLEARTGHEATLLADGRVLVAGGTVGMIFLSTETAEVYDPSSELWSYTGSMNGPRSRHTMTPLPSGDVLVAGGITGGAQSYGYHYDSEVWSTHPCQ